MGKLNEFFSDCLKLPYKSNSQDNPEHEKQVENLLIKHNINYVYQPNGSQNFPDFYVYVENRQYSIECKTSKGTSPLYNGGLPKPGSIYIFSSEKYNETTLYNADDIVLDKKRKEFSELVEHLKRTAHQYKKDKCWENDSRGFDFYIRNMFIQNGGKEKTDYFLHKDRERCERNVLEAIY